MMPNHYHLLLHTPNGNLSRCMRQINGIYTQRFNHAHEYDGQLFRGRYKSILVEADSYILELIRYIHMNPVLVYPLILRAMNGAATRVIYQKQRNGSGCIRNFLFRCLQKIQETVEGRIINS